MNSHHSRVVCAKFGSNISSVIYKPSKHYLSIIPDNLLGQRRYFVGSFVGSTSTNDVSSMSFCSSGQLNCQPLVRCWSNSRSPTSPAYANVMPTILFQVYRVGPTLARHDLWAPSIIINSLEIFDFPYIWCFWLQQFIS